MQQRPSFVILGLNPHSLDRKLEALEARLLAAIQDHSGGAIAPPHCYQSGFLALILIRPSPVYAYYGGEISGIPHPLFFCEFL